MFVGVPTSVDKPPMQRRPRAVPQVVAQFIVFRIGVFPVRRRAPESALPKDRPERAATERRLHVAVAAFQELERTLLPRRAHDLFVKHPVFGDLTLGEFMTFHIRHAEHHARQVKARIP